MLKPGFSVQAHQAILSCSIKKINSAPYAGVIIQPTANSDWLKDPFKNVQMDMNVGFGS